MSLSDAELAEMRVAIADLLPDTCNILEVTEVPDGQGGVTQTWGTATAGLACRVDSVNYSETLSGGAIQPFHGYVISLPYDTVVAEQNRVEVGSDTYNVTSEDSDKSWNAVLRVYAELVNA